MLNGLIIFFVFVLSYSLTYAVRLFALHKKIIDIPNARSSHSIPTPRGGGAAIVISFYVALIAFYLSGSVETTIFYGLLGISCIAIIGFIDDHSHIPSGYRLLVHFCAASWACYWFGVIPWSVGSDWLYSLLWGVSLLYLVWLLNLYNFMDGIDGFATVEAITVLVSASLMIAIDNIGNLLLPMPAMIMALWGFLFWNWPPAKIFMGDVGSAFIGITIGAFSLITANNGSLGFTIWLILLAVFITDATYTLLTRFFRDEKIYEAHRVHAYQYLSRKYGHKYVTLGVLLINVFWLLPLAWMAHYHEQLLIGCFFLAYTPLVVLAIKYRAGLAE